MSGGSSADGRHPCGKHTAAFAAFAFAFAFAAFTFAGAFAAAFAAFAAAFAARLIVLWSLLPQGRKRR